MAPCLYVGGTAFQHHPPKNIVLALIKTASRWMFLQQVAWKKPITVAFPFFFFFFYPSLGFEKWNKFQQYIEQGPSEGSKQPAAKRSTISAPELRFKVFLTSGPFHGIILIFFSTASSGVMHLALHVSFIHTVRGLYAAQTSWLISSTDHYIARTLCQETSAGRRPASVRPERDEPTS